MHRARIDRTGDTLTIAIPEDLAARLHLAEGDSVEMEESEDKSALIIWLGTVHERDGVDPERSDMIEKIIERRRAMLESLAQR